VVYRSAGSRSVLLTGATGYVGGRLLRRLEADPRLRVRCLTQHPEALAPRVGIGTEVVKGDVVDPPSLAHSMRGVHTAYYLIHSMGTRGDFEALDRAAATNFAVAARRAGVKQIVYLGGLGDGGDLSARAMTKKPVGRWAARWPVS
jgi:uncharacterized protein YbjT (DUF2867 family)